MPLFPLFQFRSSSSSSSSSLSSLSSSSSSSTTTANNRHHHHLTPPSNSVRHHLLVFFPFLQSFISDCHGHGHCNRTATDQQKQCVCDTDWYSTQDGECKVHCSPTDDGQKQDADNIWCQNGTCRQTRIGFDTKDAPVCKCDAGFVGTECEFKCDDKEDCSGHGECNTKPGAAGSKRAQCICNPGWLGASCDIYCDKEITCSGHGTCVTDGPDTGQCTCDCGFYDNGGQKCQYHNPDCDEAADCYGHGCCSRDGQCECTRTGPPADWFFGPNCNASEAAWKKLCRTKELLVDH